jgi:hypothetical protein
MDGGLPPEHDAPTLNRSSTMARKFFYICAGMLMLALSYHLGAGTAGAQAPGNPVVAVSGPWVYTANGDAYLQSSNTTWSPQGNIFTGGPTPALHQSWGQVKARYQNTPGTTVTPGADNR